jgi:hypothetical protein
VPARQARRPFATFLRFALAEHNPPPPPWAGLDWRYDDIVRTRPKTSRKQSPRSTYTGDAGHDSKSDDRAPHHRTLPSTTQVTPNGRRASCCTRLAGARCFCRPQFHPAQATYHLDNREPVAHRAERTKATGRTIKSSQGRRILFGDFCHPLAHRLKVEGKGAGREHETGPSVEAF